MKKFVFVYYGGKKGQEMSDEDRKASMDKWMAWFGTFKDQQVDGGNPFGSDGMSVMKKGTEKIADDMWPAKGYTIINAKDMGEATEIASRCPMVADDEKDATVRVYEALPM